MNVMGPEMVKQFQEVIYALPGNTHHFHWAKSGEYVTQITAMGRLDWST